MKTISSVQVLPAALLAIVLALPVFAAESVQTKEPGGTASSPGQELGCLAMNIYHEGRGEPIRGREAIASVTMNRVRSDRYPDTVCAVVWQRKQFSWTGTSPRYHVITDFKSWQEALEIARLFINGTMITTVGNATHYHATSVRPYWRDRTKLVAHLGRHYFYAL